VGDRVGRGGREMFVLILLLWMGRRGDRSVDIDVFIFRGTIGCL